MGFHYWTFKTCAFGRWPSLEFFNLSPINAHRPRALSAPFWLGGPTMASDYTPAAEGIPQYFLPMLDDRDRNLKYHAAITAAIRQFKAEQRRPPRVLDVGVGTGMLSAICLEAGCASVTGLDTNETMCHLADLHLGKLRSRGGGSFQVVHCPGGKAPAWFAGRRFDMLVSEILGTLTTSESMLKYLTKYARAHLDVFVDEATGERRVYAVPQRTAQHYASYAFPRADLGPTLSAVLEATLEAAAGRFLPTNDGGLGLGLHLYPRERVGPRRTFYEEDYTRWPFSHSHAHSKPEPLQLHAPPGGRTSDFLYLGERPPRDRRDAAEMQPGRTAGADGRLSLLEWEPL